MVTPRRCEQFQHGLKDRRTPKYGITQDKTGDYEVDHLIPRWEGANSIRNLWPQSSKISPWNSYVKDTLERKLHKLVCAGHWISGPLKAARKSPP
jgi:hypothetical protein